jgi:hypothetical protein
LREFLGLSYFARIPIHTESFVQRQLEQALSYSL